MPRPRRCSRTLGKPRVYGFEPDIVNADETEQLRITMEDFESLRLKDY